MRRDVMEEMSVEMVERLDAVVGALEAMVEKMAASAVAVAASHEESVEKITATVASERETELERKLAEAEARIEAMSAASAGGRKTVVAGRMMAKAAGESLAAGLGAIDAALVSLTVEQRIAVKSELMRAGLV